MSTMINGFKGEKMYCMDNIIWVGHNVLSIFVDVGYPKECSMM